MKEKAIIINVSDQQLMAIIHQGCSSKTIATAVLIVVGGPQYRVGSHRQFIQLARYLANEGITVMRFDYRGMGDSEAEKQQFDAICDDTKAAIDSLFQQQPKIQKVVIWGLCDAASAALIYAHKDARVSGLVLLNPWLENEKAMAKTMVKYYYLQRLLSKRFWIKLISGNVNFGESSKEVKGFVKSCVGNEQREKSSYQVRMLNGLQAFDGKLCLILSGTDLTAREFDQQTNSNQVWQKLHKPYCEIRRLAEADHTFSSAKFKREVELITCKFVQSC
ncbi:hydrolase 1, exosortase A system-associated [Thalassotalea sp. 42_200_T64]|nr:hydrolase 1, exosortase A system-associated [Thalassotalea sp. 42_200_T64]